MAKTKKEELYRGFLNLLRGELFGWDDELKDGDGALEDLLEKGTVLGKDGKRIPGKGGRSEADRSKVIADALKKGKAVYIYKKGEEYPREVHYDKETGKFSVSEPVNQIKLEEVKKPHWFTRIYLNLFSLMFRGKSLQSVREWKHYEHRKEAIDNAMAKKRVDRRRRFDPILKGKSEEEKNKTKTVSLSGEVEKTKEVQPEQKTEETKEKQAEQKTEEKKEKQAEQKVTEEKQPAPEEKKVEPAKQPEQPGISELKELIETLNKQYQELREELKAQKELNAEMKKALDSQGVTKESEAPQQPMLDGKEAVGKVEAKKDFFKEEEKPEVTEPQKDLDAVEKEPVPEEKTEQPAAEEKKPAQEKQAEEKAPAVKSKSTVKMPGKTVEEGMDPLFQIASKAREEKNEMDQLLRQLTAQEKRHHQKRVLEQNPDKEVTQLYQEMEKEGYQLPSFMEKNLRQLQDNAEKAKQQLEKNCAEGKRFSGGEAVRQIIAYNDIKNKIENGMLSPTDRAILSANNGAKCYTDLAGLTDAVKYAENTKHDPSFFREHYLNQNNLNEITKNSDKKMQSFVSENFKDEKQLQQALNQPKKDQPGRTVGTQPVKKVTEAKIATGP